MEIPDAGAPEMAARALRLSGDWPQAGIGRERTLIERRQCPGMISPSCESSAFCRARKLRIWDARHARHGRAAHILGLVTRRASEISGLYGRHGPPTSRWPSRGRRLCPLPGLIIGDNYNYWDVGHFLQHVENDAGAGDGRSLARTNW